MLKQLFPESMGMHRRLFNTVLKMMPKGTYYIKGIEYKKLYVACCIAFDTEEHHSVAHKINMKRACYGFISKLSMDDAYRGAIKKIFEAIHHDNIRLG